MQVLFISVSNEPSECCGSQIPRPLGRNSMDALLFAGGGFDLAANVSTGRKIMRLDKYLKVSRLIKRRTVANEACDAGRVLINGNVAKASASVKVGDEITINFGNKDVRVRVLDVQETVKKEEAKELFEYL